MAEINSIGKVVKEGNENHDVRGTFFPFQARNWVFDEWKSLAFLPSLIVGRIKRDKVYKPLSCNQGSR
jgi:hypothetical protein